MLSDSGPIPSLANDYTDLVLICVFLYFMCVLSVPMLTLGPYSPKFTP